MKTARDSTGSDARVFAIALTVIVVGAGLGLLTRNAEGDPSSGNHNVPADVEASTITRPLEMARQGFLECAMPIDIAKSCAALTAYRPGESGGGELTSIILLDLAMPLTWEHTMPLQLKNGQLCGAYTQESLTRGQFRYDGQPLSSEARSKVKAALAQYMAPYLDKEICAEYYQEDGQLWVRTLLGGEPIGKPPVKLRWVLPEAGYGVGPHPSRSYLPKQAG